MGERETNMKSSPAYLTCHGVVSAHTMALQWWENVCDFRTDMTRFVCTPSGWLPPVCR